MRHAPSLSFLALALLTLATLAPTRMNFGFIV